MCRFFATLLEPASSVGTSHTWPRPLQQAFYMNTIAKWTSDVISPWGFSRSVGCSSGAYGGEGGEELRFLIAISTDKSEPRQVALRFYPCFGLGVVTEYPDVGINE